MTKILPYEFRRFPGTIFRYSVISFIYAFLLLALPWLGPISERNIRSKILFFSSINSSEYLLFVSARFRLFVLLIGLISLLTILAQIIFQSILLAKKSFADELNTNCNKAKNSTSIQSVFFFFVFSGTELRQTLRYFGLERFVQNSRNRERFSSLSVKS